MSTEIRGGSRMSAVSIIEEIIKKRQRQIKSLESLKVYIETNPPSLEIEELLWALLVDKSGGFYI